MPVDGGRDCWPWGGTTRDASQPPGAPGKGCLVSTKCLGSCHPNQLAASSGQSQRCSPGASWNTGKLQFGLNSCGEGPHLSKVKWIRDNLALKWLNFELHNECLKPHKGVNMQPVQS